MKLNQKGFNDTITITILGGIIGALFITSVFVWQEIDKQNTLAKLYNSFVNIIKFEEETKNLEAKCEETCSKVRCILNKDNPWDIVDGDCQCNCGGNSKLSYNRLDVICDKDNPWELDVYYCDETYKVIYKDILDAGFYYSDKDGNRIANCGGLSPEEVSNICLEYENKCEYEFLGTCVNDNNALIKTEEEAITKAKKLSKGLSGYYGDEEIIKSMAKFYEDEGYWYVSFWPEGEIDSWYEIHISEDGELIYEAGGMGG